MSGHKIERPLPHFTLRLSSVKSLESQYPQQIMHTNSPPPNGQDNNNRRWSINLLLNPEEDAAFHPSQGACPYSSRPLHLSAYNSLSRPPPIPSIPSHIPPLERLSEVQRFQLLPSFGTLDLSLDLLTTQGPQPKPIYQDHPASQPATRCPDASARFRERNQQRHQQSHKYRHQSSPSNHISCSRSSSMSPLGSRSESPPSPAHSNIPYTLEQVHFIQYHREDKSMQWQAIVDPFRIQFPRVYIQLGNTPERRKGALECRYYRAQMYPKMDDGGNIVLDQNGQVEMVNIRVRDRNSHPYSSILEDYFKLVTRCPERILTYSWTDEADKEKARKISKSPCVRNLCCLYTN